MGFRNLKIGRHGKRYLGKRLTDPDMDDRNMSYCRVCGFPINSEDVARRKRVSGAAPTKVLTGETYPTDTDGDYYLAVTKYCPFCGSADWK